MKVKLDENLPPAATEALRFQGHEVDTVLDEGLGGKDDVSVWAAAQQEGRFFVTQDLDFSDARRFVPGTHHGIMVVRIPDDQHPMLPSLISGWFRAFDARTWPGGIVVATLHKVRVVPGPGVCEG